MTAETEALFNQLNSVRTAISQVLPPDAVNYIMTLLVQDKLSRKYKNNVSDTANKDIIDNQ